MDIRYDLGEHNGVADAVSKLFLISTVSLQHYEFLAELAVFQERRNLHRPLISFRSRNRSVANLPLFNREKQTFST